MTFLFIKSVLGIMLILIGW